MVANPNFTSNFNAESTDVVQDTSTTDKHERNLEHREQLLRLQREELLIHERNTHNSGFSIQISDRGGNAPPPMGGTKGGGLGLQGGGMTRNFDATTICVMHDIIYKQHHTLCML